MNIEFKCYGILEYTATYRTIHNIQGVDVDTFDLAQKTVSISGVNQTNEQDVCTAMQQLGWRKTYIC